jgi:hypothetical protein
MTSPEYKTIISSMLNENDAEEFKKFVEDLINKEALKENVIPFLTHIRLDLFGIFVTILSNQNTGDIVVAFRNSADETIKKMFEDGYYIEIFGFFDVLIKFILPSILGHDKFDTVNIIITGFNLGGELANIFCLYNKFKCRTFFNDYASSINDCITFNIRDIAFFFKTEYKSLSDGIKKGGIALCNDVLFGYGGAIALTATMNLFIMILNLGVTPFIVCNFWLFVITSSLYYIVDVFKSLNKAYAMKQFYVFLCKCGFFDCAKCTAITVDSCKFLAEPKTTKTSFPELVSYEKLMKELAGRTDYIITSVRITKYHFLSALFEMYQIAKEIIPYYNMGKISAKVGIKSGYMTNLFYFEDGRYRTKAYSIDIKPLTTFDEIPSFVTSKEKPHNNIKLECEKAYNDCIIGGATECAISLEKKSYIYMIDECKQSDGYSSDYAVGKISNYVVWIAATYGYNGTMQYPIESAPFEDRVDETFKSFLWFVERHIHIQENYKKNINNFYQLYFATGNEMNPNIRKYSKLETIALGGVDINGNKITRSIFVNNFNNEFIFFPYISNTDGNIGYIDDTKSMYKKLNDNYIGSVFRSVIEDLSAPQIKEPKFKNFSEAKVTGEKRTQNENQYYEKELVSRLEKEDGTHERISGNSNLENYLKSEEKGKLLTEQLSKSLLDAFIYNTNVTDNTGILNSYYARWDIASKIRESNDILEKFYDIKSVEGTCGISKELKIGILENGTKNFDDKKIAYIYNDGTCGMHN